MDELKNSSNKNWYSKITENVYKFNTIDNLNSDNIFVNYSNALQLKKNKNYFQAINLFKKCELQFTEETKDSLKYEIFINIALLNSEINIDYNEISSYYYKAIKSLPDRAEPYYYLALFCNKLKKYEVSYELLKKALNLSYESVSGKYNNLQRTAYGKFLLDELSVSCYWLQKYEESINYIEQIIDDLDFIMDRERLQKNLKFAKEELAKKR